ncbi:PREDICTED: zona pellucida sperm-binding protein 4-like [Nanorana parkeri]|uniref:zona pellucida sperm-binding protein 4-like n=1 Tax=Nanorana parkeri TaxID=125878 RepID=UPI000854367D|nr:PREDICTED: zona pellucida sperm-binding protein 4-like [Nanorana parkeri]
MSFSLPLGFEAFAADITILDNEDQARSLQNDSACGLWIGEGMETTPLITATYDGCYIRKEDEDYVMTVIVDRLDDGELDHHKRDIKCPIQPALDAPSASDCAAFDRGDRLACADNSVSRDVCEGMGCCFSPGDPSLPCYFGNKVTARCTSDGHALVAISKDVTVPSLILDSVHVVNVDSTSCPGLSILKTSAFVAFVFPLSCGGKQVSGNEMVYENTFEATKETRTWQGVSITRDSAMRLMVRCHHSQTAAAPLMVEVVTLPPPPPISTTGPLFLEMRIAKDPQYSSYYRDTDYPLIKGLRDLVFLEVRILRRKDPSLVLILNDCWATPSSDPTQQMQWSILVDGCPSADEDINYLTQLSPVGTDIDFPNHYKRFVVSAFIFVEQQTYTAFGEKVYFHCSASVCIPSAGNPCASSCSTRQKRAAKATLEQFTVSKGPVNFITIEKYPNVQDNMSVEMENMLEMEMPMNPQEFWDLDMLNETDDSFVGAKEGPIDRDLFDADKLMPRRVKDDANAKFDLLLWLRGAAVGGGILLVVVTILGIWKCHRRPRPAMHTVKI